MFRKKLKPTPQTNTKMIRRVLVSTILLFLSFLLTGCGEKQWLDPLQDQALEETAARLDQITASQSKCPKTLKADLALYYSSPLQVIAQDGFFQFSQPSSFKFVITNPLGLPVWAIAGDQKNYQILNTMSTQFVRGTTKAFGIRTKIPDYIIRGSWTDWIMGINSTSSDQFLSIEPDVQDRGVWITLQAVDTHQIRTLVDLESGVIIERRISSKSGREVAKIKYSEYMQAASCFQPKSIVITGLDYGTEVRLIFSDVVFEEKSASYSLSPPPHYFKKILP
jgi:hypothetical protein